VKKRPLSFHYCSLLSPSHFHAIIFSIFLYYSSPLFFPLSFLSSYCIFSYSSSTLFSLSCFLFVPYSLSTSFPLTSSSSSSRSLIFFSCCLFNDASSIENTWRQTTGWLMSLVQLVEWELAREVEILGETPPLVLTAHDKSHMIWIEIEPGPPQ
jgi:hypothetical protein